MLKRRSGLGSLIPGADLTANAAETVPVNAIAVNPYQPRRVFAPEALEELAASIRQYGILQPLTVRTRQQGGYELIAGERRLHAARKVGLTEVPVIVRECTDREMLALALVENLQREDLNPMEAAQSYRQLVEEFQLSQAEVAEQVGKSRSAVANTLRLLALPPMVQEAVSAGALSEGHARALLAIESADQQCALYRKAITDGLSVRALEALINPTPRKTARRKTATRAIDPNFADAIAQVQRALGTRVRVKPGSTAERGAIEIDYFTANDLDRLLDRLRG